MSIVIRSLPRPGLACRASVAGQPLSTSTMAVANDRPVALPMAHQGLDAITPDVLRRMVLEENRQALMPLQTAAPAPAEAPLTSSQQKRALRAEFNRLVAAFNSQWGEVCALTPAPC
ncbi:MAG: hypothetical protein HQL82_10885 [Magnetococcales bacterium]|nr:hypothetical protein [Magnetococcales bacterium]